MPGILSVGRLLGGSAGGFSPAALFAAGEQGVWYDPSDFSTIFQDSTGTTPVTAVEQPVGLVLDKSKRLALGTQLVPTSYSGTTGGTWAISTTQITRNASATGSANFALTSALTVGRTYVVSFQVTNVSGDETVFRLGAASSTFYRIAANGTYTARAVAVGTGAGIFFAPYAGSAGEITLTNISVREIAGNHALQSTSASRPVLKQDENGRYYLLFDGTDDSLSTRSIDFTNTDKMSVFAGLRKLSDTTADLGAVAELSADANGSNGTFLFAAPYYQKVANSSLFASKGTIAVSSTSSAFNTPSTAVFTGLADIGGDIVKHRLNGTQVGSSTSDQGTGNYGDHALYIGRRGGSTFAFNGRIYGLIVRGAASTDAEIANTETWLNRKTVAYA